VKKNSDKKKVKKWVWLWVELKKSEKMGLAWVELKKK